MNPAANPAVVATFVVAAERERSARAMEQVRAMAQQMEEMEQTQQQLVEQVAQQQLSVTVRY